MIALSCIGPLTLLRPKRASMPSQVAVIKICVKVHKRTKRTLRFSNSKNIKHLCSSPERIANGSRVSRKSRSESHVRLLAGGNVISDGECKTKIYSTDTFDLNNALVESTIFCRTWGQGDVEPEVRINAMRYSLGVTAV